MMPPDNVEHALADPPDRDRLHGQIPAATLYRDWHDSCAAVGRRSSPDLGSKHSLPLRHRSAICAEGLDAPRGHPPCDVHSDVHRATPEAQQRGAHLRNVEHECHQRHDEGDHDKGRLILISLRPERREVQNCTTDAGLRDDADAVQDQNDPAHQHDRMCLLSHRLSEAYAATQTS
jgi:hypothetical protein